MQAWLGPTITGAGLVATLLATARQAPRTAGVSKMLASTGFIVAAVQWGAWHSGYGQIIVLGLSLAWLGDLALISTRKRWFIAGLGAFLLGHVAYVVAFSRHPPQTSVLALAGAGMAVFGAAVLRWLWPHAGHLRWPVVAYVGVICAMIALGIGVHDVHWSIPVGALLFGASDLFVARQRFVAPGTANRMLGLPLYYAGQLVLAYSIKA